MTEIIAAASAIGTLLSSVFVLLTLRELKTQRKHSYKPELVIPEVCFNFIGEHDRYLDIWKTDDSEMLSLNVHNVGLGVAKNVKLSWKYDHASLLSRFNNLSSANKGSFKVSEDRLDYFRDGALLSGVPLGMQETQEIDFILPAGVGSNVCKINIPRSFISITSEILKNGSPDEIFDLSQFNDGFIPLTLTMTYQDIGGLKISNELKIEIKFFTKSIRRNTEKKSFNARGRVYINYKISKN